MAEKDKKYYWLKLHRDFFKRHDIQIIEAMPNGKDYILFYLKLLCESVDHEGNLRFSKEIPYNEEMLSTITHTNIDVVRSGVKLFAELGMMEIMTDGTYFMREVHKMLGSETYWAKKKREQREKENPQIDYNTELLENVQQMSNDCPTCPSKSKSIDKDKDKDIDIEKERGITLDELYIKLCPNLEPYKPGNYQSEITSLLKAMHSNYISWEDIENAFKMANESEFLQGKVTDWRADFKWLIKLPNIQKVLSGNYKNKTYEKSKKPEMFEQDYGEIDDLEKMMLRR